MALSDLQVFNEQVYTALSEVIAQQIELFNGASRNTIVLSSAAHRGDFKEETMFQFAADLVRRRNPYGTGSIASKKLSMLLDTMVKVAAGSANIEMDPGQFKWIQTNPAVAGAALGQQLAQQMLADMLNTSIMAGYAALSTQSAIIHDITGETDDKLNPIALNKGAGKFGDRASDIAAWVMHSTPRTDFYTNALTNANELFTYGTVNVTTDPFGRVFVVSDCPALVNLDGANPDIFHTLGLVPGAIIVDQNNDFTENWSTINGDENIKRSYQSEWSYQLGIKGFSWDKSNGGKAPTDAALATGTNWDKIATSHKDLAGVIIQSN